MARVFVVDDERQIQVLYGELLRFLGHQVVESAMDGVTAVLRYELMKPPPDLVLMDHRMPRKDGLQATREIIALDPGARILVVSADPTISDSAITAGAMLYIEKPFAINDLNEAIQWALEQERG